MPFLNLLIKNPKFAGVGLVLLLLFVIFSLSRCNGKLSSENQRLATDNSIVRQDIKTNDAMTLDYTLNHDQLATVQGKRVDDTVTEYQDKPKGKPNGKGKDASVDRLSKLYDGMWDVYQNASRPTH